MGGGGGGGEREVSVNSDLHFQTILCDTHFSPEA